MRLFLKLFVLVFVALIGFTSCDKELSEENGLLPGVGGGGGSSSGTSVFTLDGAPGTCNNHIVGGTYTVGTPLNAINQVVIYANVSSIGTYTITTASSNGISFSATGTFTSPGIQPVLLQGSGTPTTAGTFNYKPGSAWCSFPVTIQAAASVTPAVGTLDCATATTAGTFTQGVLLTSANTLTIPVNVTTAGTFAVTTTSANGVVFTGSGTLATGAQTIVLTGSGLPANSGAVSIPVALGTSTCNVSITFAAGTPPAVGTLDCASATNAGTFTQGVTLSSANTVSIPVTVTTAGPYYVTTTANGVTFTGSGNLSAGAQTITLTGSGVPSNAGAITFNVSLGTSTCGFSLTFIPGLPATDYFRVKIDGVLTTFHVNLLGDNTPLFGGFTDAIEGDVATGSDEHLDITVNDISPISANTYLHPFGIRFATSRYVDQSGLGWQPADNSSPTFSVVVTAVTATRITGTFSGQYKSQNGTGSGSKIFTEGAFSVPIP